MFLSNGDRIGQILLPEKCKPLLWRAKNRLFMTASQSYTYTLMQWVLIWRKGATTQQQTMNRWIRSHWDCCFACWGLGERARKWKQKKLNYFLKENLSHCSWKLSGRSATVASLLHLTLDDDLRMMHNRGKVCWACYLMWGGESKIDALFDKGIPFVKNTCNGPRHPAGCHLWNYYNWRK